MSDVPPPPPIPPEYRNRTPSRDTESRDVAVATAARIGLRLLPLLLPFGVFVVGCLAVFGMFVVGVLVMLYLFPR